MHVVFRECHGLEETEAPINLGQSPADLVMLSFSDSDLGAFAAGWHRADGGLPPLRLANLAALRHPLSVDTYVERTLEGARGILIRLIGGEPYWPYGLQQVEALARRKGIALAVLPADGRPDPRLDEVSTLPVSTLKRLAHLCDAGGAVAAQAALAQMALAAGLYAGPVDGSKQLPRISAWTPADGVIDLEALTPRLDRPRVVVCFYRAYLTAADLDPIETLLGALEARGFDPIGVFAPSLKAPDAAGWLSARIAELSPVAVVNATAFSAADADGVSPLDAAGSPVFQIALSTSRREDWVAAERGLSPADLAMHVVLPEVDGRIFAGVVSFKEPQERDAQLEYSRVAHRAERERIEATADRISGWARLARKSASRKRLAMILSTYPGKSYRMAHAVGLDALASAEAMLADLGTGGYDTAPGPPLERALVAEELSWPESDYLSALEALPRRLRDDLSGAWGAPGDDPACRNGAFRFAATRRGRVVVALQPERGLPGLRVDEYHDLSRVPRHAYVAFYLWLRQVEAIDALIHVGAHGTLEWLPGKSVALSSECWPEVLTGPLPVVYPFIVNDPGEAAQARRRIGAVTIGHIPPPMKRGGVPERLIRLEALLDEFSTAIGLDPKRRDRLQADIRDEARALGVEADLGLNEGAEVAEAITRIDRFVCDIKESQFGDGLHVYGRKPDVSTEFDTEASAEAERMALRHVLAGRRVAAGPSGSPYRGRMDVLPTGRNLFAIDPRAVPSRAAHAQGMKLAGELIRRHLQEEGDYPRELIVDLWGSATMRTAGEEFAMALHLLGAKPVWDDRSGRVSGVEILPVAHLDRPRVDVTLRVSGLFRDVFPALPVLFGQAVRALSERDEAHCWNPHAGKEPGGRVYGPAPGSYGLGMGDAAEDYSARGRKRAAEAWLTASQWMLDSGRPTPNRAGIEERVAGADGFVHVQDLPETDLLLADDYAAHEAGFAAASEIGGGAARLYHLDSTDPHEPRARTLREEIARVVRARAANPDWIAGMMRHGFQGGAEIAATLDHLAAFANLAGEVEAHLFDLYHAATLDDAEVLAFLEKHNPEALCAMRERFAALLEAGLWRTRRNSVLASPDART